jgi:hypothetical protein
VRGVSEPIGQRQSGRTLTVEIPRAHPDSVQKESVQKESVQKESVQKESVQKR